MTDVYGVTAPFLYLLIVFIKIVGRLSILER